MAQQRRSTVAICRPAGFNVQSDFDTALAQAAIDTRVPLSDEDPKLTYVSDKEEILTCSGEGIDDRILNSRMYRLTYGIKAVPLEIWGHAGWAKGVVSGDVVTLLPKGEYQPPATSLIYGHDGSGIQPIILKSMVLMKMNIALAATGYTVSFEWLGHGAPSLASAYDWPDCTDDPVARFKDGAFSIDSTSRLSILSGYEYSFDNKPDPNDPFTRASPDITRNERADLRDMLLKCDLQGEVNDALYLAGTADPTTRYAFSFRIGTTSDGVTFACSSALFEHNDGEKYSGGFKRSELSYNLTPRKAADTVTVTRET